MRLACNCPQHLGAALTDAEYERHSDELLDAMKPLVLQAGFLSTLAELAKREGWGGGDYTEVAGFVRRVYLLAGRTAPDLAPYLEP